MYTNQNFGGFFMICKKCGHDVQDGFNNCPNCGESLNGKKKEKKPIFKKWWFWLIVVVLAVVVLGSLGGDDDGDTTDDVTTTVAADAGETSAAGSTEPTIPQTWSKNFYVDDFDEPTDEWFIERSFVGTFSNSATTDSRLTGRILIDAEDISFFLYEYNTHQVKNPYSRSKKYVISARLDDGSTKEFAGHIYSEGDRILVSDSNFKSLKDLLVNGGNMKFFIYEEDNSVTNYLFEISSDNLKDIIE